MPSRAGSQEDDAISGPQALGLAVNGWVSGALIWWVIRPSEWLQRVAGPEGPQHHLGVLRYTASAFFRAG